MNELFTVFTIVTRRDHLPDVQEVQLDRWS